MLETILPLLTICFFARMSPGPDMMLLIRHTTASTGGVVSGSDKNVQHPYAAYACVVGICAGLTFHVTLSVLGLALVIKSTPLVFHALQYAGAGYLVYIGWKCFTDSGSVDMTGGGIPARTISVAEGFRDGLFCNLLNPKVTMFILSVFMQFIGPDATLTEKVTYGGVILLEAVVGWSLFVLFLNTSFMQSLYGTHAGKINKATGLILFALGAAIVLSS